MPARGDVHYFGAGPAPLPTSVLEEASKVLLNYNNSGIGITEISHRSADANAILAHTQSGLRQLLDIPESDGPDGYQILFLQGGAMAENALIPMNLLGDKTSADYVNTGEWSKKSIKEAGKYCKVNVAASAADRDFTYVPTQDTWQLDPQAAYVHVCTNETIGGVEYHWVPDTNGVPLVADMSSHILSRAVDVSKYGVIYGGAQKNIGPAGLTLVVVREDLLGQALPITPSAFNWKEQADNDSMLNTPPTYSIYIAGLVFEWLLEQGGIAEIERRNIEKASLLYDYLDQSQFYSNPVAKADRSRMNIPFRLADSALDEAFLQGAKQHNMVQLKGHRVVGGMRASIYNAMPIEGVRTLSSL